MYFIKIYCAEIVGSDFDVKDERKTLMEFLEKFIRALSLGIDPKTASNHLHKTSFKKKLDLWVSHELSASNMIDQICRLFTKIESVKNH